MFEFVSTEKNQPMSNFLMELGVKDNEIVQIEMLKKVLELLPQMRATWVS
jgi:hypothetical protein